MSYGKNLRLNTNSIATSNQISTTNLVEDVKKKEKRAQAAIAKQSTKFAKKRIKKVNTMITQPDHNPSQHTVENQDTWNPRASSALNWVQLLEHAEFNQKEL